MKTGLNQDEKPFVETAAGCSSRAIVWFTTSSQGQVSQERQGFAGFDGQPFTLSLNLGRTKKR